MRMRRKPWARPELSQSSFYVECPSANIGNWSNNFPAKSPLHLELGCGKGSFIAEIASRNKDINYIAIDIKSEVLVVAKRNIELFYSKAQTETDNILIFSQDIERIDTVFNENDVVDRIYINFCNPWPKNRHKKKRLTHSRQLEKYKAFLSDKSEIIFKTDDIDLYNDSLLYFKESGFEITFSTDDLYSHDLSNNIMTEHERMFVNAGKNICMIRTAFNR